MTASWSPRSPKPKAVLTPSQLRVLSCIAMDYTDYEIQAKLRISQTTLSRYIAVAREATSSDTRTGAVMFALRQKLIKLPGYTLIKDEHFNEGDAA